MTYNEWKTANPFAEELVHECHFCGEKSDQFYCSKGCELADSLERC